MTWWEGRMVAFDLETTAPDPEDARIVTAAIALCGGGVQTETVTLLADPGVDIPAEATAVHGITTDHARAHGHPASDVVSAILAAIEPATGGWPLVIFNARYDLTVLDRECRRHGLPQLGPCWVVDPLVIDKHLDRYRRGSRKLDAVCAHYGATLDGAHDAAYDALAAARVAYRIGQRGKVIRRVRNGHELLELQALQDQWESVRNDLAGLHRAQIAWAQEQAEGLAEHFARQGKTETVRTEWPVIPWTDTN